MHGGGRAYQGKGPESLTAAHGIHTICVRAPGRPAAEHTALRFRLPMMAQQQACMFGRRSTQARMRLQCGDPWQGRYYAPASAALSVILIPACMACHCAVRCSAFQKTLCAPACAPLHDPNSEEGLAAVWHECAAGCSQQPAVHPFA